MPHWRLKRTETLKLVLLATVLVAVEVLHDVGVFAPAELVFYDLWHRMAGQRYDPEHVVLVVIDEPTLNEHRDDPLVFWTPYVAKASAVARAAGAKVVGLDFLFSVSPEAWLDKVGIHPGKRQGSYDQAFREEIGSGQLIQVSSKVRLDTGYDSLLLPYTDYLLSIPDLDLPRHVGLAGLVAGKDSAVRAFRIQADLTLPADTDPASMPRFDFAPLLALRAIHADLEAPGWRIAERHYAARDTELPISFAGPPGTFPRLSMRQLLKPDALADPAVRALKGKVVIIGGEYVGMGDVHPTPYASTFFGGIPRLMTGPEVQANIVETLLGGRQLDVLPNVFGHAYVMTVAVAGIVLFSWLLPFWGLLALFAMVAASLVLSYVAFTHWLFLPIISVPMALAIAYLGALAVKLGAEARERERITGIFSRYVSDNVVDVLIDADHPPDLGGIQREVTVLFSDIRNFTTISEQLDAHEVVEFLNHYFQRICDLVLAEGGTIDKFIGDAIMVQFGAPVHYPDHALRALRAALAIRQEAEAFRGWMQERFADKTLPDFQVGIGIHSGLAVVGNIGSTRRSEYTVIGDTVNVASRIEGMTKGMGCTVLASKETLDAAGPTVETGKTDSVKVKGRSAPVELFEIIGLRGEAT